MTVAGHSLAGASVAAGEDVLDQIALALTAGATLAFAAQRILVTPSIAPELVRHVDYYGVNAGVAYVGDTEDDFA